MPAVIAVALVMPPTGRSVELFVVVPFPSWPVKLYPEQSMPPPASRAHESWRPAAIAVAPLIALTAAGVGMQPQPVVVVVPFPSSPVPFLPQHSIEPLASSAHECVSPAVIAVALVIPLTGTGVELKPFVAPFAQLSREVQAPTRDPAS